MKNLYTAGVLCSLLFTAYTAIAQVEPPLNQQVPDKPLLFSALPDKFECNAVELEKLFFARTIQQFNWNFNSGFQPDVRVSGIFKKNEHLTSINARLVNYDNALLNISMIREKETVYFTGRIVSIRHGDILFLKKEKDKYFFIKQQLRFTMVE